MATSCVDSVGDFEGAVSAVRKQLIADEDAAIFEENGRSLLDDVSLGRYLTFCDGNVALAADRVRGTALYVVGSI